MYRKDVLCCLIQSVDDKESVKKTQPQRLLLLNDRGCFDEGNSWMWNNQLILTK